MSLKAHLARRAIVDALGLHVWRRPDPDAYARLAQALAALRQEMDDARREARPR